MRLRVLAVLAVLPLTGAPERRDQPPSVSPIRIDGVVANPQGEPIQNLRLSNFALLEDGVPKPVASAELRTLPASSSQHRADPQGARGLRRVENPPARHRGGVEAAASGLPDPSGGAW